VIIGRLETRNFEWTTLTNTPAEALENLRNAWELHATAPGVSLTWELLEDSVTLEPINIGDTHTSCQLCVNLIHN
jgi:hypothetical protein